MARCFIVGGSAITTEWIDDRLVVGESGDAALRFAADDIAGIPDFGRYQVTGHLGFGGTCVVYDGWDPELRRPVAIKCLLPGTVRTIDAARIRAEAIALASLSHPNVVPIYDVGEVDGTTFIVMEKIVGVTLRSKMDLPMPWRSALAVFIEAGRGLAAAHALGLVHRDFKPENVLIDEAGRVRVADFGLVRRRVSRPDRESGDTLMPETLLRTELTQPGKVAGTPAYMAPEQFSSGEVDERADQFSFCVALYEAVQGHRPFAADTIGELVRVLSRADRKALGPGPNLPRKMWNAVRQGLAARPEHRHRSMTSLLDALEAAQRRPGARWFVAAVVAGGIGLSLAPLERTATDPDPVDITRAYDVDPVSPSAEALAILDRGDELLRSGRPQSAREAGSRAVDEASSDLERGRAYLLQATAYEDGFWSIEARDAAREAYAWAERADDDATMVRAASLVMLTSSHDDMVTEGRAWVRRAQTVVARGKLAEPDRAWADLVESIGHRDDQRLDEALAAVDRGLARDPDQSDPRLRIELLCERGLIYQAGVQSAKAAQAFRIARDEGRRTLGAYHPRTLWASARMIDVLADSGQVEAALAEARALDDALAHWPEATAAARGSVMLLLADAQYQAGLYEDARASIEHLESLRRMDPPQVVVFEVRLLRLTLFVDLALERFEHARTLATVLVDRSTEHFGPDDIRTLHIRLHRAQIEHGFGEIDAAERELLELRERGRDTYLAAFIDQRLADVAAERGDFDRASTLLAGVVETLQRDEGAGYVGLARLQYARALWGARRNDEGDAQLRQGYVDLLTAGPSWWSEQGEARELAARRGVRL